MGILYIVATPIGNLKDITLRALEVLASVDKIISEDTRVTSGLLRHYQINKPQEPLNDFNEAVKVKGLIDQLLVGKNLALVSDAGTPLVSDPGFKLVREASKNGIKIIPIPGASSLLAGLVASGFPTDKFFFAGFPPKKGSKRNQFLDRIKTALLDLKSTVIIFESPHRLTETLTDIQELGNFRVAITRELTKTFEEVAVGEVGQLIEKYTKAKPRGEITLIIEAES